LSTFKHNENFKEVLSALNLKVLTLSNSMDF